MIKEFVVIDENSVLQIRILITLAIIHSISITAERLMNKATCFILSE